MRNFSATFEPREVYDCGNFVATHIFQSRCPHESRRMDHKRCESEVCFEIETAKFSDGPHVAPTSFCYDKVMDHIGQCGRFQLRAFLWLCIPLLFPGVVTMSFSFIGALPDHRCYIDGCDDEEVVFMPAWINNTIPMNDGKINHCNYYNDTWESDDSAKCSYSVSQYFNLATCKKLVYDNSVFKSTIATEFGLACEDAWKLTLANSIFMFGTLLGAGTLGHLADMIGRKPALTLSALILGGSMLGVAFSVNFYMFCAMRFFCGVSCVGLFDIAFVWGLESVGRKYKIICGLIYQVVFSSGSCLLGIVAYYVRDWRMLQLVISLPILLIVTIYWLVPESIRWLASKNHYSNVRKLVADAAETNGKDVPYHLLIGMVKSFHEADQHSDTVGERRETVIDVLASPILVRRLLIIFFTWIAACMGYYGLVFSSSTLSSNVYLNYELTMFIDIPAYITGSLIIKRIGRRSTISSSLILSGVACLLTGLLPEGDEVFRLLFFLTGKFFMAFLFGALFSYTADLFPTTVRSAIVGMCSTSGRIGGILAPVVADGGKGFYPALPYIVFATVNVFVGTLCLLLPETDDQPLPENIQDAISLSKR